MQMIRSNMEPELAALIAQRFVQRKDVKAVQVADGGYRPNRNPWKMGDFRNHLAGTETFGHYLCDSEGNVKLFVLDVDLRKYDTANGESPGKWVQWPDMAQLPMDPTEADKEFVERTVLYDSQPREEWADRHHPARTWHKYQLATMAETLTSAVKNHLGIPCAAAYSGAKGVHVYGFTGVIPAADARALALEALEVAGGTFWGKGGFVPVKGKSFFRYEHNSGDEKQDWMEGFANLEVEVYPKQETMEGKDLGNLVRLPLGVNRKSARQGKNGIVYDPTFFLDFRGAHNHLAPHPNPTQLLLCGDPWKKFSS